MTDIRIDRIKLGKVTKTAEGYLKGNAIVTRTGVFKYQNLDGTTRYELRHPEDVLIPESLETLKSLPITHDHPTSLVTAENASHLSVGMTGETIKVEDEYVGVSLNITHKDAIAAINNGKQELSAGYRVDLIPEVGQYNGEHYTHRQTNINYNHLAIVDKARAGAMARLNLDGAFVQCEEITKNKTKEVMTNRDNDSENVLETIAETVVKATTGIDIHAAVEVIEEVAEKMLSEGESTANTDSIQSIIKKLQDENEELKNVNIDSLVAEKTKQRIILLNKVASVMNTDGLIEKSEREIMETVIKAKATINVDFTNKSDDYVSGRFDALVEDNQYKYIKKQMTNLDEKIQEKKPSSVLEMMKSQHKKGL